jgi:hypothetical protein
MMKLNDLVLSPAWSLSGAYLGVIIVPPWMMGTLPRVSTVLSWHIGLTDHQVQQQVPEENIFHLDPQELDLYQDLMYGRDPEPLLILCDHDNEGLSMWCSTHTHTV